MWVETIVLPKGILWNMSCKITVSDSVTPLRHRVPAPNATAFDHQPHIDVNPLPFYTFLFFTQAICCGGDLCVWGGGGGSNKLTKSILV